MTEETYHLTDSCPCGSKFSADAPDPTWPVQQHDKWFEVHESHRHQSFWWNR